MKLHPHFSQQALADASTIQDWTVEHFGEITSLRYDELLEKALADLLNDPACLGVSEHPAFKKPIFVYHLRFSRIKNSRSAIARPRHFMVFRVDADVLTVLRILHDSMDLSAQSVLEE
jgi:toxin ParE1/3/4